MENTLPPHCSAQLSVATAHAQAFEDMIHVSGNINSQTWVRTHLILQTRLQK